MSLCVVDIPVGVRMSFRFEGGPIREGEVLHNYGGSLIIRKEDGEVIQFDAQDAKTIEPMDQKSEQLWLENVARRQAEFEAMMKRMREAREAQAA